MFITQKHTRLIKISVAIVAVLTIGLVSWFHFQSRSQAADMSKFNPGNIMSDAVMSNRNTMTVQQIQTFLDSKNPCNNRNIHMADWYPHLNYNIRDGRFVCMAQERFNGKSAAQIIWQAGQDYNINPQVLIVLLEKEQGLVSDTWPNHVQYRTATGFGCPDTAPCEAQYFGLENQLRLAANLFRTVLNGGWSNYPVGNTFVQYHPNASCGGTTVNIQNRATSALYRYTPYQPNQAALNAGYGTGNSCSSYGNRNFWALFSDWFGSPTSTTPFAATSPTVRLYANSERTDLLSSNGTASVKAGSTIYATVTYRNTGGNQWQNTFTRLTTANPRSNQNSPFYHESWMSTNRVVSLSETSVQPSATGSFNFTLQAPENIGTSTGHFGLVAEGMDQGWMDQSTARVSLTTTPARDYNVSILSQQILYDRQGKLPASSLNAQLRPGQTFYLKVVVRNTGAEPLGMPFAKMTTSDPRNHRSSVFHNGAWLESNRPATMSQSSIPTGQVGEFIATMVAPDTPGTYTESFGLVADGRDHGWMDEELTTITTTVVESVDRIESGSSLSPGECLRSSNMVYRACYQTDSNFVVYSLRGAIWASNTDRGSPRTLAMQTDGNLVVYTTTQGAIWATHTDRQGSSRLVMQNDGNLVVYNNTTGRAVWATHTNGRF